MNMDSGGQATNTSTVQKVTKNLVYLFKAPKDEEEDEYFKVLSDAGCSVVLLPVLSFNFINKEQLLQSLEDIEKYCAVILTSTRGVEAVSIALKNSSKLCDLSKVTCYVVGKATGKAARKLGFKCKGEDSGNAEELLKIILSDLDRTSPPVLYPCASIRRDTISDTLQEHDIEFEEINVYETVKDSNLDQLVEDSVKKLGHPEYIVYFSPSAVKYTQTLFNNEVLDYRETKVIAIGPTTEKELRSSGFTIYGVARKPDPGALLSIIQS